MFAACCCAKEDDSSVAVVSAVRTLDDEYRKEQDTGPAAQEVEPAQAPAAPVDDGSVFTAVLRRTRPEEPLGVKADFADEKILHIVQLLTEQDNPVLRYNSSTHDRQIKLDDYVLSVNGVSYKNNDSGEKISDALRKQLTDYDTIEVVVSRPHLFEVEVEKKHEPMGLDLTYSNSGTSLVINSIAVGAVQKANPEVKEGDRIVKVDGVAGGPQQLLQAIRGAGDTVSLVVSRPFSSP